MASVFEAAASGDEREILIATRDRIARKMDDPKCSDAALAALSLRIITIAKELRALDPEGPDGDEPEAEDGEFDPASV